MSPLMSVKRSYYLGVSVWAHWLPVLATGLYLALLVVNLAPGVSVGGHALSLAGTLTPFEMIFLLMVGPLFLTRFGNLLAAGVLVYLVYIGYATQRLLPAAAPAASHMLVATTITVALLADKMPWIAGDRGQRAAQWVREALLLALCIAALGVLSMGMIRYAPLARWFNASLGAELPPPVMLGALVALFGAWISVALGVTRHFLLPVIALPTALILAFVSGWPSILIVAPFVAALALSLATAERRIARRQGARRTVHGRRAV